MRIVEAVDVEKIQTQQAKEDQELRPLNRITAEQSPVFDQQKLQWYGKRQQEPGKEAIRKRAADLAPAGWPAGKVCVADAEPAFGGPHGEHVKKERVRNQECKIEYALNDRQVAHFVGQDDGRRSGGLEQAI